MSGEMIRDQALAVAGLLSTKMNGPSVRPPRPNLGLRAAFGGSTDWQTSQGEDRYRRGLYTSWRRTTPYPSMSTFDAPSREFCSVRRLRTNTPLQALVTLNDPVFVEAAQSFAQRIMRHDESWESRIHFATDVAISRSPSESEILQLRKLYDETLPRFRADKDSALQMAGQDMAGQNMAGQNVSGADSKEPFDVAELATWTVIGNVLLNLDETLAPR